jgi:hypothetical protein
MTRDLLIIHLSTKITLSQSRTGSGHNSLLLTIIRYLGTSRQLWASFCKSIGFKRANTRFCDSKDQGLEIDAEQSNRPSHWHSLVRPINGTRLQEKSSNSDSKKTKLCIATFSKQQRRSSDPPQKSHASNSMSTLNSSMNTGNRTPAIMKSSLLAAGQVKDSKSLAW